MAFCELATTVYPGCDDMMNRVHQKDNIAAAAVLELREGAFGPAVNNSELAAGQKICVVTAHIHWDPQFCDVKLIQTLMLVDQLVSFHFSILSNFLIFNFVQPYNLQFCPIFIFVQFSFFPIFQFCPIFHFCPTVQFSISSKFLILNLDQLSNLQI